MRESDSQNSEISNELLYKAILDIHKKIDKFSDVPFRLKLLERVVYGFIAIIMIAVISNFDPGKNAKADCTELIKQEQIYER